MSGYLAQYVKSAAEKTIKEQQVDDKETSYKKVPTDKENLLRNRNRRHRPIKDNKNAWSGLAV